MAAAGNVGATPSSGGSGASGGGAGGGEGGSSGAGGGGGGEGEGLHAFCQGLAMLVLVALLDHETLDAEQTLATVQCVAFCMCETNDMRVAAAGTTVLNSAMALARRKSTQGAEEGEEARSGNTGEDGRALKVWNSVAVAVLRAMSSSASLAVIRKLVCYQVSVDR